MNIKDQLKQDKKIAEIRSQLTPGQDDSYDQIYSDNDQNQSQNKNVAGQSNVQSQFQGEAQQTWDSVPLKQHGQSQSLQPLATQSVQKQASKQQQVQQKEGEKQQQTKKKYKQKQKQKQEQEWGQGQKQKQQADVPKKTVKKYSRYDEKRDVKHISLNFNSKFIYAAHQLLRDEFKQLIKPQQGWVRFDPHYNSKQILIYYYEDKDKDRLANIVDQCIDQIQIMEMSKKQAESGIQLSYKFYQQLIKQKMSFFKDNSQNFKTASYYICGKVKKNVLYQKISEIKNMAFIWMHIFRYENTRSYRAILRRLFETPEVHSLILQRFKAKQIQVAYLKKDYPLPMNADKKGVLVVLTCHGQKKLSIHQQIQQSIVTLIRDTFAIFCLTFIRRKQLFENKYTPKVDKVTWFFITQNNMKLPISYLYIIVKKSDFQEVKPTIIKQVEFMKLNIVGRRFFRGFAPQIKEVSIPENCRIYSFPRTLPYSWTVRAKKGEKFDWLQLFSC